jgi:hypothetical protein
MMRFLFGNNFPFDYFIKILMKMPMPTESFNNEEQNENKSKDPPDMESENLDFEDIEFSENGSMISIGDSQWSEDALTESSSSAASSDDEDPDPLRRPIDVDIASGRMPKITIEASSGPVRWFEV